ncbi:ABC transporter ATP-binding protein [Paenibacillus daejeonensis]|uniref:ABC transporter ATP-binding protein n=1 Tax=Paenibacillus daejeonensis TaxID=135193 RepID=UPI00035ECA67|nr:ABC transporter ATP-binding protein [Paenibacillus daejeonensis]
MALVEISNLSKVYESHLAHRALDNLRLEVESGEFVGIMGPSGSGKTTLLNAIATIDEPTSGHIRIAGLDPLSMDKDEMALFRRRQLGFVFQQYNLLDSLTIAENIILPLSLDGLPVREMEQRLSAVADKLGITSLLSRRIYEISGGQRQRVAIARAIIHRPALILADEPTGNLDSKSSRDVMETFAALHASERTTILMVTHDAVAASFCSRVVFIKDGRLYNDMYQGGQRQAFFQKIIDMLSLLGGDSHDLNSARLP